jgi:uncharacterized RDD family membrane protein YckC
LTCEAGPRHHRHVIPESVPEESILGLDNVQLDLPIAGVGTRVLAGFVDYLLVLALNVAWITASLWAAIGLGLGPWWGLGLVVVGFFVIEYGYFAGSEVLMRGQTAGKRLVGLRVVTRLGGRPGTSALLVRNAVRTVDVLAGVPLMMTDPLARRVGDRLGGTVVVRDAPRTREMVIHRVPRGWSGREVALLESFFRRQYDLEQGRAESLARTLLAAIERDDPHLLLSVPQDAPPLERLRRAVDVQGV